MYKYGKGDIIFKRCMKYEPCEPISNEDKKVIEKYITLDAFNDTRNTETIKKLEKHNFLIMYARRICRDELENKSYLLPDKLQENIRTVLNQLFRDDLPCSRDFPEILGSTDLGINISSALGYGQHIHKTNNIHKKYVLDVARFFYDVGFKVTCMIIDFHDTSVVSDNHKFYQKESSYDISDYPPYNNEDDDKYIIHNDHDGRKYYNKDLLCYVSR